MPHIFDLVHSTPKTFHKPFASILASLARYRGMKMRIWKLTPTNLDDPIWKKWSPEPIIVRAEGEREARRLAVEKTVKMSPPI